MKYLVVVVSNFYVMTFVELPLMCEKSAPICQLQHFVVGPLFAAPQLQRHYQSVVILRTTILYTNTTVRSRSTILYYSG